MRNTPQVSCPSVSTPCEVRTNANPHRRHVNDRLPSGDSCLGLSFRATPAPAQQAPDRSPSAQTVRASACPRSRHHSAGRSPAPACPRPPSRKPCNAMPTRPRSPASPVRPRPAQRSAAPGAAHRSTKAEFLADVGHVAWPGSVRLGARACPAPSLPVGAGRTVAKMACRERCGAGRLPLRWRRSHATPSWTSAHAQTEGAT